MLTYSWVMAERSPTRPASKPYPKAGLHLQSSQKKIAKRKYNCYHKISDNREQLYPCISKDNFWFNQQSSKILDMVFYYSKFCIPGEKHVLHVRCNHVTINCRKSVLRMTEWDKNDQDRYSDLSCTSFPPSNMIHTSGVLKPVNSYELHKVLPCWYL